MASHQLIDDHVAMLARALPRDTVAEVADGLIETWERHLAAGLTPDNAAHAAITEFGSPQQTVDAFVAHAPGRRMAVVLLATGPVVGACWGATLIAAHAWTWPVPSVARLGFGFGLLGVVTALAVAAASRHSYRLTRLGTAGGVGLVGLDAGMLVLVALAAVPLTGPVLAAIPASVTRIALTLRGCQSQARSRR